MLQTQHETEDGVVPRGSRAYFKHFAAPWTATRGVPHHPPGASGSALWLPVAVGGGEGVVVAHGCSNSDRASDKHDADLPNNNNIPLSLHHHPQITSRR